MMFIKDRQNLLALTRQFIHQGMFFKYIHWKVWVTGKVVRVYFDVVVRILCIMNLFSTKFNLLERNDSDRNP